jgi:diacylglycerol O-acyltransferase
VAAHREWKACPAPRRLEMGLDELGRAVLAPWRVGSALAGLATGRDDARHSFVERARAVGRTISDFGVTTPVAFNQPIGAYRRIDWLTMSMDRIRALRKAAGGTVNDIVLATATGAIGRFLHESRGMDLAGVQFRVLAPVSTRVPNEQASPGNHVSAWAVALPLGERNPMKCLEQIALQTQDYKSSKRALGAQVLTEVAEWSGTTLLSLSSRMMNYGSPFNSVITNIPGPRMPLYLLESRLIEIHPHVPILGTLGLGIALFSYDGTLSWGFTADWDLLPDLHDLSRFTEASFCALEQAAGS